MGSLSSASADGDDVTQRKVNTMEKVRALRRDWFMLTTKFTKIIVLVIEKRKQVGQNQDTIRESKNA